MATVRIDGRLKSLGPGPEWASPARDVQGLLDALETAYPGLRTQIRDEAGELRRGFRIFVDGEDIRNGAGTATELVATSRVEIVPAMPGG